MLREPEDLLTREPESFASDEHRRTATAFKQAWESIAAQVPPQKCQEMRLWLATLVLERAKWHPTVESLRNEVVYIAISEALRR